MAKKDLSLDELGVAALRSLVIDMTNKAKSGHPGMALDVAPAMYALFHDHLISNPKNPEWSSRDRFVLSAGHVSALLYATLHVCGYDLSMEDLQNFRQLGSCTPGHPERGCTAGVDATSGPLGQGVAQAVGMAFAERALRAQYPNFPAYGHYTYCLCGDGCLQEGVAQEAISLAGHHHLGKLILIYDANGATLDGPTNDSLSENIELRFLACEWNVLKVGDSNDVRAISKAIAKAKKSKDPTLIILTSTIGYGSAKQGSHKTHGSPLGEEDGAHAKEVYGYDYPPFTVPQEVYASFRESIGARGEKAEAEYRLAKEAFEKAFPEECARFNHGFTRDYSSYEVKFPEPEVGKVVATRNVSGECLNALHDALPFTLGGAADVASSVQTVLKNGTMFTFDTPKGRDVHWGIREFAMASVMNGIALHGGFLTYGGSFLVFSDYLKPALRMAALQKLPTFYLFSHDSIAVGEDGPTHQPVEQVVTLRSIPGFETIRPCDAKEVVASYEIVKEKKDGPTALILTRQGVPTLEESSIEGAKKGGYLIYGPKKPQWLLVATGSEVSLALNIAKFLNEEAKKPFVSVVSLPSWSRFEEQSQEYRDSVLCAPYEKRISLEMMSTFGWAKYAKYNLGIDSFGLSAKAADVIHALGFDEAAVCAKIKSIVEA